MKKLLFLSLLTIAGALFLLRAESANAQMSGCVTPPTDTGRVTLSVTVTGGTYRVWSRMKAPDSTNNSFYLQIGSCAVLVGNSSSIPANTWTWVDYRNGSSSNKIDATLSAGTHVVTLIGNEDGVGVDKILMTQDLTCTPTGTSGDNCPGEINASPTPGGTDNNPPVISNISAYEITGTTAKVTWNLDEYASGQIEYRTQGSSTWQQTNLQTCCTYNYHIQSLSNLTNGTTYDYRVKSADASGNESVSGICTFTAGGASTVACSSTAPTPTAPPATSTPTPTKAPTSTPTPTSSPNDTTAPVISNPRVEEITGTSAKFRWELDEPGSGQVEYRIKGTTTWTKTSVQSCCTYDYHIQSVSGLIIDTIYEYRITSADAAGNTTTSSICTFTSGGTVTQACSSSGPTPTNTPTPTNSPTPTPTNAPTSTPMPTPLPTDTVLRFQSVKLHGIGSGGDNTNPNSLGNTNPLRTTRQLSVELIDASGNSLPAVTGNVTYRSSTSLRDFIGDIVLPSSVSTGSYLIKVKSPQFLKKQVVGIITVTKGAITNIPTIALTTGDMDNNNALTIGDYNILIDCYSDLLPAKNCNDQNKKTAADLSDDGAVNANDYNLFLRELSVVSGD